jgi:hypothetical protein
MRLNYFVGLAIAVSLALSSQNARLEAQKRARMSIQQVRTYFTAALLERGFTARLRAELEQEGLRFVATREGPTRFWIPLGRPLRAVSPEK